MSPPGIIPDNQAEAEAKENQNKVLTGCWERGNRLFTALTNRLSMQQSQDVELPDLDGLYDVDVAGPKSTDFYGNVQNILREHELSLAAKTWYMIETVPTNFSPTAYVNWISSDRKCLLLAFNFKEYDQTPAEEKIHWSQLFMSSLIEAQSKIPGKGGLMEIEMIWRNNIANDVTLLVIETIWGGLTKEEKAMPFHDITQDMWQFKMILGTPNVSGVVRFLTDHASRFLWKTIRAVRVLAPHPPARPGDLFQYHLAILLEKADLVSNQRSTPEPRTPKKQLSAAKLRRLKNRQSLP